MDYDTSLASSIWALKVIKVEELQYSSPRPSRRLFDILTTFIKGNLRILDECMGDDAHCLLYVEKSLIKKMRVGLHFPFRMPSDGVPLMSDEDILDVFTDSGVLREAAILPDPSTENGASKPRQGLSDHKLPDKETEKEFHKLLEQVLTMG